LPALFAAGAVFALGAALAAGVVFAEGAAFALAFFGAAFGVLAFVVFFALLPSTILHRARGVFIKIAWARAGVILF
jgi:hypothetical protein